MEIIFVRHGESEANFQNRDRYRLLTGQLDCPLTRQGLLQAQSLQGSELFHGAEVFFTSDLRRARDTAACFADPALLREDARLRERSLGVFEGKTVEELASDPRYAAYFTRPEAMSFRHSFTVKAPGGEHYADVCRRVGAFWAEVRETGCEKIVVVSHFVAIRCLMKELQGLSEAETLRLMIPNCQPIRVTV